MCWNATVSLTFAIAMFASAYGLQRVNYSGTKRATRALLIYGAMQFTQWLNWLTIHDLSEYPACSTSNRLTTYLAYVIVQLQPFFNVATAMIDEMRPTQDKLFVLVILAMVSFVWSMIALLLGEMGYESDFVVRESRKLSTTYDQLTTCTYLGPGNYLLWRFKVMLHPFMPTYAIYHFFSIALFYVSNKYQQYLLFIALYGLAFYSWFLFPDSAEVAAYWCKSTIFLPIAFWFDAAREKFTQKKGRYVL